MRRQILLASLALTAALGFGQSGNARRGNGVLQGQVYLADASMGSMTVELDLPNGISAVEMPLQSDGSFELSGLAPGRYDLSIVGSRGQVIHRETVVLSDGYQRLSVFGKDTTDTTSSQPAGTVSVQQLQHKVPAEARGELDKGVSALKKGDTQKALDHFQKAKLIDPECSEAYNGSGAAYVDLGRLQEAADQFQKAVDLVPEYSEALTNLSIVLCRMKRYQEAGDMARRALKLNSSLIKMRYILGLSLTMVGGDQAEALKNVEIASTEIFQAHLLAGKLLEDAGRKEEAAKEVEAYLRASPADSPDRKEIELWLADLQRK